MANSEGRKGGMNFNVSQLSQVWKPTASQRANPEWQVRLGKLKSKAGSTVCQHMNEPFECPICRGQHAKRI